MVPPLVSRSSRGGAQTLSMGHNTDGHIVAYDIHGVPATSGATRTDVHTPLRARAPGQSEASTTTVIAYGGNDTRGPIEVSTALNAHGGPHGRLDFEGETFVAQAVAFAENSRAEVRLEGGDGQTVASLKTGGGKPGQSYPAMMQGAAIRRLTPKEAERLQGFSDGYTAVTYRGKEAADGPRYKACGNAMAVPVLTWILTRIEAQLSARADGGQEHAA